MRMDTNGRDDSRMTIQHKNQVAGQDFEIIKKALSQNIRDESFIAQKRL